MWILAEERIGRNLHSFLTYAKKFSTKVKDNFQYEVLNHLFSYCAYAFKKCELQSELKFSIFHFPFSITLFIIEMASTMFKVF